LAAKNTTSKCALIVIANGFNEMEVVSVLSVLRRAGLLVKSIGLTSGLINSAHGIQLMPDLPPADLEQLTKSGTVRMVILPGGEKHLARLETDPRVHRLLRQVIAEQGQIIASFEGRQVLRAAAVRGDHLGEESQADQVFLGESGEAPEAFAQDVIHWIEQPYRV
jgi:putative intracellular protease/amidase